MTDEAAEKKMEPMEKAIFTGKVVSINSADKTVVVKGTHLYGYDPYGHGNNGHYGSSHTG